VRQFTRIELACRDPRRLAEFYGRVLEQAPSAGYGAPSFWLGNIALVLRSRGDALFPLSSGAGTLLAFAIAESDLESWHRRLLTARIPILEGPGHAGAPPRHLRMADPEGNVVEFFAAS
jgi:catechol 2,3-dioxygenase-like lactoylglutathione lyase family enzyme